MSETMSFNLFIKGLANTKLLNSDKCELKFNSKISKLR